MVRRQKSTRQDKAESIGNPCKNLNVKSGSKRKPGKSGQERSSQQVKKTLRKSERKKKRNLSGLSQKESKGSQESSGQEARTEQTRRLVKKSVSAPTTTTQGEGGVATSSELSRSNRLLIAGTKSCSGLDEHSLGKKWRSNLCVQSPIPGKKSCPGQIPAVEQNKMNAASMMDFRSVLDRPPGRPADRPIDRPTDRPTDRPADRPSFFYQ